MSNLQETPRPATASRAALIEINIRWLRQALELLTHFDDTVYSASPAGFAPHRAGGHIRHILDFYQCFLRGLETRTIDYDARTRDHEIETSRAAASAAIRKIIGSLETSRALRADFELRVRSEDAVGLSGDDVFMRSSINRELQVLSSHTIHHFALLALTLRLHGVAVQPDFGMAPSTLRFLAQKSQSSAEAA